MLMHCNQCEQTTKGVCCVKIGTCGKDPKLALAQDELVAALIAAAPVVEANAANAALFEKALFATLTNVNFDCDKIDALTAEVKALAPNARPYEMVTLWGEQEDVKSLHSLLLFGLKGISAYAYHARILGYSSDEIDAFYFKALDADFSRAAVSEKLLAGYVVSLKERLQGVRVKATARQEAEGHLVVMEGWAETETSARVDALLEEYPNVIYLKSDPTPEDDTPVKLKNNRFARIFEMIGDLYARPKYGTLDLTPFFAPFYMLFFGICLNDAGYGLVLLAAGLVMLRKFREPGMMRRAAWFATLCAIATIVFGGICGSFFGLSLAQYFPSIPFFDFQGKFFIISLVIGLVQILFGMALNIWTTTRCFGIAQAFGQIGWFVILLTCVLGVALPMASITIPGFTAGSVAFYVALGIGFVLLLLLNNVKRNPLINVGAGLWDLYNNITGLLSDVLSYIRLFAIGLSGGVLALVFNTLAEGFVPEGANIFVRLLVMVPILLIGHGINLFMSTISSFVHPMRLTFVEFFKNAGFEMATRSFDPIRKMDQTGE